MTSMHKFNSSPQNSLASPMKHIYVIIKIYLNENICQDNRMRFYINIRTVIGLSVNVYNYIPGQNRTHDLVEVMLISAFASRGTVADCGATFKNCSTQFHIILKSVVNTQPDSPMQHPRLLSGPLNYPTQFTHIAPKISLILMGHIITPLDSPILCPTPHPFQWAT